jgi:hypothetical protein
MITNINSLNAYSYRNVFPQGSGKLFVPVQPSMVVYAQFDHISGVPSTSGQGVRVSKIQILNTLIDQLVTTQNPGTNPYIKNSIPEPGAFFSILA